MVVQILQYKELHLEEIRIILLMKKHIKTVCGLEKYEELVKRKGVLSKLRFYWFVFFAVISDFVKKKINERDYRLYH